MVLPAMPIARRPCRCLAASALASAGRSSTLPVPRLRAGTATVVCGHRAHVAPVARDHHYTPAQQQCSCCVTSPYTQVSPVLRAGVSLVSPRTRLGPCHIHPLTVAISTRLGDACQVRVGVVRMLPMARRPMARFLIPLTTTRYKHMPCQVHTHSLCIARKSRNCKMLRTQCTRYPCPLCLRASVPF